MPANSSSWPTGDYGSLMDADGSRVRECFLRFSPLPNEYQRYAREDTHYLLYIYDQLRNQLLDMDPDNGESLKSVYRKSKIICQKVRIDSHPSPVRHRTLSLPNTHRV